MEKIDTNLIILGSGPAGCTSAIYAARADLRPVLVHGSQPGGQLTITTDVENYPGFASPIQGPWLMEQMIKQVEEVGCKVFEENISEVDLSSKPYKLISHGKKVFQAKSIIISTGASAKWLGLESEKKFTGFGVSACATCDAFFFKDKIVAVVGGGNTAVEEALYLTKFASKVVLIHRRDKLRAEKVLQNRLFKNDKIKVIWNSVVSEIIGISNPKKVKALKLKSLGNSSLTDLEGYIKTKNQIFTSIPGVFAAGDVHDKTYRQAVTAAGFGCMAALEAEKFLTSIEN